MSNLRVCNGFNHLPDWSGLNKFARGQKGADKAIDPVLVR
jgi:hypothetical protein